MNDKFPKIKIDERTRIEYHLKGGYYIPNLVMTRQKTADNKVQQINSELKEKSNLTENMKNIDMLYWVGTINSIKAQAEEIVLSEIIYS